MTSKLARSYLGYILSFENYTLRSTANKMHSKIRNHDCRFKIICRLNFLFLYFKFNHLKMIVDLKATPERLLVYRRKDD